MTSHFDDALNAATTPSDRFPVLELDREEARQVPGLRAAIVRDEAGAAAYIIRLETLVIELIAKLRTRTP